MTATKRHKTPAPEKKGGPEARAEAMRLLSEGYTLTDVAVSLKVRLNTVREWRDSPAGAAELAKAREARAASFADAAEGARRIIRENLERAAQVLVDQLDQGDATVRSLAARTLLDRGGVPRTERIETPKGEDVDLAKLTDDELVQFERLRAKARLG